MCTIHFCCFKPLREHSNPRLYLSCQNNLVIDTPRVRKQTRHYSSMKEDDLMEYSELESDSEDKPIQKPRRPQDRTQGYPRSECFRVEKNLLVYGWVQSGNGHVKVLLLVLTALCSFLVGCSSLKIYWDCAKSPSCTWAVPGAYPYN